MKDINPWKEDENFLEKTLSLNTSSVVFREGEKDVLLTKNRRQGSPGKEKK